MNGELILFAILAAISVVCAIAMVVLDNPVRSALNLVAVMVCVAALFVLLHAAFLAAIQIIVYAGAVMVLFLFVIMLLNLGTPDRTLDPLKPQKPLALVAGIFLVIAIAIVIMAIPMHPVTLPAHMTGATDVGNALFSAPENGIQPPVKWLFPFEAVSILLLIAAVGAVILAKRKI